MYKDTVQKKHKVHQDGDNNNLLRSNQYVQ